MLNHKSLVHTAIHDRLNANAVDRALRAQANRLCGLLVGVEGNRSNQAQLQNREIAMLTQG